MNKDRLNHSYAVANKIVEIAKEKNLDKDQLDELFILGYIHDIGYQFGNCENHNVVGGSILKNNGYKYWKEVYYHGVPNSEYKSLYLDLLNMADMMIDTNGNDVGFEKRLEDIKSRYGKDSIQYNNCIKVINELLNNR